MAHTFISQLLHFVFSTAERRRVIAPDLQPRLWSYMGGIARENKMKALCVGGTEDHAHLLLSLPATISIAKAMQLIKGGSSKWVHDNFPDKHLFAWQEGYGAFSLGISDVDRTVNYIKTQKEHHGKMDFKQELIAFLQRHKIEYDERYIWN